MQLANTDDFEIRPTGGKGFGLFTQRPFRQGDKLYRFDYWSAPVMPLHATNHSCDANGTFTADGWLVAVRDIAADEEVTFNYLQHPIPASPWNFACECGAANCVGWVNMEKHAAE
ncbi:MAG: SET domain-containing protein [Acidobacteriota bacterium]